LKIPFLGSIPFDTDAVQQLNEGIPVISQKSDSGAKNAFQEVFKNLEEQLA
jgi:MinD-like ATPase involved in chromosome partitioning or flagellar assembly